jgi:5-oxoprolinase (ATP-hydrolysing)
VQELERRLKRLGEDVKAELAIQGFEGENVRIEEGLNCRFDGTDTTSVIVRDPMDQKKNWNWVEEFKTAYKKEFGFLLAGDVVVDDVKVSLLNSCLWKRSLF